MKEANVADNTKRVEAIIQQLETMDDEYDEEVFEDEEYEEVEEQAEK